MYIHIYVLLPEDCCNNMKLLVAMMRIWFVYPTIIIYIIHNNIYIIHSIQIYVYIYIYIYIYICILLIIINRKMIKREYQ